MVVERLRLFVGATELNYGSAQIVKSNDYIVDTGFCEVEANAVVTDSATIDWKRADGSTTILSTTVEEIDRDILWKITSFTNGDELMNTNIEKVYNNMSPEDIAQDIIDNFTENLTYASTETSGFTIEKYIAQGYLIDVLVDLMNLLEWGLWIDSNDNAYFEPRGVTDNGLVLTNGSDFQITKWAEDKHSMINAVKVIGGQVTFNTRDTSFGTGTDKTFNLSEKPVGSVKVFVDDVEQIPLVENSPYEVNPETPNIVFSAAPALDKSVVADYSYEKPAVVEDQNDASINTHKKRFKKVPAPFLKSFADTRAYASKVLDAYSTPEVQVKGYRGGLDFDTEVNELVKVVDNIRGREATLVITKITIDAAGNKTIFELGPRVFEFFDWQRRVEERIKIIERQINTEDSLNIARTIKNTLRTGITVDTTFEYNSPVDSFVLGHQTLGRLRASLNTEADCSDSTVQHNGTWTGTTIDGSQYDTSGYRLSAGVFGGAEVITVEDNGNLDLDDGAMSIVLAVKVSSLPGTNTWILNKLSATDGYGVRINASNQVELFIRDTGLETTFNTDTTLVANTYQHVVFTNDATGLKAYVDGVLSNSTTPGASVGDNSNNLEIGKYSANYFTGSLDEVRLYEKVLSQSEIDNIIIKLPDDAGLIAYYSMDNPRLGNRESDRTIVP